MGFEFKKNQDIKVYLSNDEPLSLKLATNSFIEDIKKIFSCNITIVNESDYADILIASDSSFPHIDEYFYSIYGGRIYLTGKDDLGAIYAIYAFLEKELNIPPFYKIEGLELPKRNSLVIENKTISEYPNTRFRGWFVNDEDLLSEFKSLGNRDINYNYYNKVIHPDMMDIIAETALRYRMNVIIPSTLVDIMSPYEEKLIEVCSNRGLYVSQHHIEPLGVSKFGFEKFANNFNLNKGFSYVSNKEALTLCWKAYIEKWKKYPRVIWQLGLRGGTDRPVWDNDSSIGESNEERGELISTAIEEQYSLIKEIYPYEVITTSTLWMEGASLLKTGDLHLPKDTIIVFADIGMSQLFGDDFFSVKRRSSKNYGVYYHAAYWHTGPHLAECLLPNKIKYAYELVNEYNSNYYSILNVANIKDLTFSLYMHSQFTFYKNVDLDNIYGSYTKLYSIDYADELKEIMLEYYSLLGDIGEDVYHNFCNKYNFDYHKYENLPFPVSSINDGMIRSMVWLPLENKKDFLTDEFYKTLENGEKRFPEIYKKFLNLSRDFDDEYILGFNQHWTNESLYLSKMFKMGRIYQDAQKALLNNDIETCLKNYDLAKEVLLSINTDRKKFFTGEFENWFNGDGKIGINSLIRILNEEKDFISNKNK